MCLSLPRADFRRCVKAREKSDVRAPALPGIRSIGRGSPHLSLAVPADAGTGGEAPVSVSDPTASPVQNRGTKQCGAVRYRIRPMEKVPYHQYAVRNPSNPKWLIPYRTMARNQPSIPWNQAIPIGPESPWYGTESFQWIYFASIPRPRPSPLSGRACRAAAPR